MLVTGVGVVEAAASVSRALAQSRYDLVINAGIAGAFEGAAAIGEGVVISEEMIELDIETGSPISLPDGARVVDRAQSDLTIVDRLVEAGFKSVRGITVNRVSATDETARRLASLGPGIESMEGFAVLRAAEIAGVPAVEIRGISNTVCGLDARGFDFAAGAEGVQRILDTLLALVTADA